MSRHCTLARLAAERRDDARAETRLRLGVRASAYAGVTPNDAGPKYQRPYTMGERSNRCRRGTVERRGGKLKLMAVRERDDAEPRFVPPTIDAVPAPRFPLPTDASAIDWTDRHVADALVNRPASMPRPEGK